MSEVVARAPEKVKRIHQEMVFELISRGNKKSTTIRKEDVGMQNPRSLNTPKRFNLPLTSRDYKGLGRGYVDTQYVPGAETIYVNDYVDAEGRMCKGLKSLGHDLNKERERAEQMNIYFNFGVLDLRKYGEDLCLAEFINTHELNAESASGKSQDRRINKMFQFGPMRKEEKAIKNTIQFEDNLEAMSLVGSLRTKNGSGGFTFDTPRIDAILNILEAKTADLGEGTSAQKFDIILRIASASPIEFLRTITDSIVEAQMVIGKAVANKVLSINSQSVKLISGEGATEREIFKFSSAVDEEDRQTALAIHLLGGNGQAANDFSNLRAAVELAQAKSLAGSKKK